MSQEIKLLPAIIGYGCAFIVRVGNIVHRIEIINRFSSNTKNS